MHMLNISVLYMQSIRKFQKALVQVDFPVYALSKQKQNKKTGKWPISQRCHFVKNEFFEKLLHANVQCVCIM